jgi:molybdenum cofactor cytidylyltransferase
MPKSNSRVTAIVLAAGLSTRMGGHPKPLLPLGDMTVIDHILAELVVCPIDEIIVVTGHQRQALERHLAGRSVKTVFNPDYASGEMLTSLQYGLRAASADSDASLVLLGDQPALESSVVQAVVAAFRLGQGRVVIPSFQMRRGHPIMIDRILWETILALGDKTLRDFMRDVGKEIYHVAVDTPSILRDMDTPDEYQRELAEYASRHRIEPALL